MVHSQQGSLYEEPLIACLAVTLDRVEGLHVPAGAAAATPKAQDPPVLQRSSGGGAQSLSRCSVVISRARTPLPADSPFGRRSLLSRLLPGGGGGRSLAHTFSLSSFASDDMMLAGEDVGDECECRLCCAGSACLVEVWLTVPCGCCMRGCLETLLVIG